MVKHCSEKNCKTMKQQSVCGNIFTPQATENVNSSNGCPSGDRVSRSRIRHPLSRHVTERLGRNGSDHNQPHSTSSNCCPSVARVSRSDRPHSTRILRDKDKLLSMANAEGGGPSDCALPNREGGRRLPDDYPTNNCSSPCQHAVSTSILANTDSCNPAQSRDPNNVIHYEIAGNGEIHKRLSQQPLPLTRSLPATAVLNTPLFEYLDIESLGEAVCTCRYW